MNSNDFRRLAAAGLSTEQIALVMEIIDAKGDRRRALQRARTARWVKRLGLSRGAWLSLAGFVLRRDGEICAYCGSTEGPMHVDHVIPLIQGGDNDPSNLVVACRACNCGKSGRTPREWRGGLQ